MVVRVGWEREYATAETEETNFDYFPVNLQDPTQQQKAEMIMQAVQYLQAEAPDFESLPESLKASAEMFG